MIGQFIITLAWVEAAEEVGGLQRRGCACHLGSICHLDVGTGVIVMRDSKVGRRVGAFKDVLVPKAPECQLV